MMFFKSVYLYVILHIQSFVWRTAVVTCLCCYVISPVIAQDSAMEGDTSTQVSIFKPGRFVHSLGAEFRYSRVIPNLPFFDGDNAMSKPIRNAFTGHLKYAVRLPEGSLGRQVYGDSYQGIGVARFHFGNKEELGNPVAVYLFQGAPIAKLAPRLSLGYEWNFGLSTGWKPYDQYENPYNIVIGSRLNAYINVGLLLNWKASRSVEIQAGADISHFSNGNTAFPNAGLNMFGTKVGMVYHVNNSDEQLRKQRQSLLALRPFPKHISYDMVFFGAWRRKGVDFFGQPVASPHAYPVVGAYFAPMYNFGYRFRAGVSIDGIYDGSANVYTEDYIVGTEQEFFKPALNRQMAIGFSGRAEYVMPLFSIGVGIGANAIHKGGDLTGTYQTFALKIGVTKSSFLHIGYNLKDFHEPNFLMIGLGFRFNNQRPSLLH
ncbi:acyloxyacyl hydrolase [Sphingobacterium psychroaquaticum]|uniref:Lipid A 3-O-deacylase (PagL) n=1 Tax=Sphingobacterium psychroaquaticum TaxID=561061 RepID=A0A1X7KRU6_9SPHI|nr:acyloxyacyl hydrolase [Sphingobacterium psychroaquaticum]SMG44040.1 Lipid A 3-O-deacylase (PagL) [Sphingobacterium psychroaquaticum]